MKHPRDAFRCNDHLLAQWEDLGYPSCPDYDRALAEYEQFVELLKAHVPVIHYLPSADQTGADSIYVHDPVLVTRRGAILCNMGKAQRRQEPAAVGDFLRKRGIPILGAITGEGTLEGGDVIWLDERTVAVGRGYRTNDEGIRQFRQLIDSQVDEFITVPLPHWRGPGEVLHLMSLVSPIDCDLAVAYSRLLPVPFREWLVARGITLLDVPDSEYDTLACNILPVAPRRCIMLAGNPRTREMLRAVGVKVWEVGGAEICLKGAGGPTCLTRPILRA
ncbi:MAG TPA: arginine deiminase family protein [Gemmatimonadales bacterium]|nr:arginine deiminase family protein [Gemmatimonadales bacterium]